MALTITQETFDDAVRENMNEFEMPVEEAIKETVDQFKAQVFWHFALSGRLNVNNVTLGCRSIPYCDRLDDGRFCELASSG